MMLARAARRKLRRDAFRSPTQLCEQLTLPWLCPAQLRYTATTGPLTTNPRDVRKQRHAPSTSPRYDTRSLATAADVQPSPFSAPFDGLMQSWASREQSSSTTRIELFDPSKPLIIPTPAPAPAAVTKYGIGGDPIELYQNLHACLRVGRMDRATAIVERLTAMYDPSAPEVVEAHNVYLQAMFELAQQNPTSESMSEIEEWYDAHMVHHAVAPNADTFVTLLRASMSFLKGQKKDNTVRKYLNMAQACGTDVVQNINESDQFSDEEWDALIRFQPDQFKEPPPIEEIQVSTPAGYASLIDYGLVPDPRNFIKPVQQKGHGLDTLKKSLNMFEPGSGVAYPHEMEGAEQEKDRAYAYMRQLKLEADATEAAVARWRAEDEKLQEMGIHGVIKTKPVQALMWLWYSALLPLVKKEMARTKEVLSSPNAANLGDDRHKYGPYLEQCTAEKLAALTVSRVIQSCARGSRNNTNTLKVSVLTSTIGNDIEHQARQDSKRKLEASRKKERRLARKAMLSTLAISPQKTAPSRVPDQSKECQLDNFACHDFPPAMKTRIGALALELLLKSATVTVTAEDPKTGKQLQSTQPAFHHHTGFVKGKRVGWVTPHHEITDKLCSEPVHSIVSLHLPMVFEPKPWVGAEEGGYYTGVHNVIRTKSGGDASQRAYGHSAIANGDMNQVLKGLDVLGKVPWQINNDVFPVMAEAWNTGEAIGGMVSDKCIVPQPPEPQPNASLEERRKWLEKVKEVENIKSGYHSQRCFQNFQLEIARAYLKEKNIYFPHSIDFRGRAYPVPPLLNHIGADMARSLLRFANGKELGTVGLQWLKIHLANLYGFDKASLREREQFTMDHISEIYDSATNPLTGRRWWVKAEDPWQCLACCIEVKNALDSPDPTRFVSHLPVHQDGTCNGLQHYAALGGDHAGASQVNLEPSDRPQDIYTGVAEIVKEMVSEDAANGKYLAQFMDGKVTRKVVKRTVMTNVYGVTFMGARLQVLDELKDMFPDFKESEQIKSLKQPAMYIAMKIFAALARIFNGAQEIQLWLGECGERITTSISADQVKKIHENMKGELPIYGSKYKQPKKISASAMTKSQKNLEAFKTSIIWTTPLKMPVVQPYRKDKLQVVKTSLQDITVVKGTSSNNTVDKRKQLQAFPPNFIHSLDAAHMILSALKCSETGLNFAAVHDSFWTHAADIPKLNVILRDAFVRMHSEDIIGRLAAEFKTRYAGSLYRATLDMYSPVGRKISEWRKAHRGVTRGVEIKNASFVEVALEAKRQELLNSEDSEKRKEGEEMVTPTSIWLAHQDATAISSFDSPLLGETKKQKSNEVKDKALMTEEDPAMDGTEDPDVGLADIATGSKDAIKAETMDTKWDMESEDLDAIDEEEADMSGFDSPKKNQSSSRYTLQAWIPLTFPPVPKKGSWDVTRLRESKYFFS